MHIFVCNVVNDRNGREQLRKIHNLLWCILVCLQFAIYCRSRQYGAIQSCASFAQVCVRVRVRAYYGIMRYGKAKSTLCIVCQFGTVYFKQEWWISEMKHSCISNLATKAETIYSEKSSIARHWYACALQLATAIRLHRINSILNEWSRLQL